MSRTTKPADTNPITKSWNRLKATMIELFLNYLPWWKMDNILFWFMLPVIIPFLLILGVMFLFLMFFVVCMVLVMACVAWIVPSR